MVDYVLVHGAWHTGQCWARMVPLLGGAGHRVFTPTLTGYGDTAYRAGPDVGLETHVEDIVDVIVRNDLTDVILVGHSYAGMVVSGVVNEIPDRIAQLVYLDAMVPEDGESAADIHPMTRTMIDDALRSESGWRMPPLPELPSPFGLFGVTDPADITWVKTMLSDQPVRCLQQAVRLDDPGAAAVPRTHIHCTVKPEGIERRPVSAVQPNGEPARVWELPTGHDCMITMPEELAGLLLRLA
ncbi:alpha/beta fold hydrolase [Tsukamurella sp. 8F]|uniref:alpha/beta fold hydrolase n=1 Tax=unclassified Tsukamurella TaxID=2633480 RepID=UPI0023B967FC|nr:MULTISPECIES: alpha/beta fold hydrolase [unclassified Tsukamurella]MDF0530192.1 alpha/beta fold hydrolase [Tsukamurella sp. 8J]MDF0586509.1 alpha/beta fold hydrolase [Tsukamurella sp. 8F]